MAPGMSPRASLLAFLTFIATLAWSGAARAQCCPGYSLATSCAGTTLTRSRWCIQDTAPTHQAALPAAFCSYGDKVVTTLEKLFNIQAKSTFEYQLDTATGGAHTGTSCGTLGDGVAYDAFVGNAYGATGFWGYLLALHEAINDWTGMASGGWPTDWWADHQSAFPNLMDFHVMNTIGVENNDQNLIKAAAAQKKRFYPGGDSSDPKVVALDNVYMLMPNGDGYAGFSHMFALQTADGVKWDNLGVPNPDVKRSEYVVAYMSLAAGQSVLKTLQGPGPNGGGNICNGTPDGTPTDKPYTCSQANVDAIATAHCAANANGKRAADMQALRGGNYANVPSAACGAGCPSECGCDAQNHCVAPWLGAKVTTDAGAVDAPVTTDAGSVKDAGGGTGAGGSSGGAGTTGSSTGVAGGGGAGSVGAAGEGTNGSSSGGSGGSGGSGDAVGAAGSSGAAGVGSGAGGSGSVPIMTGESGGSGCACAIGAGNDSIGAWLASSVLVLGIAIARRRRARR